MQANQAHPRPQAPDPVLPQMYWTQLNKAICIRSSLVRGGTAGGGVVIGSAALENGYYPEASLTVKGLGS